MLLYAGIDEAGYGPMLGPLCVAATAFEVDDHDPAEGPPDLWSRLDGAVCRAPRDRRKRVAIDDSKKLKGANGGRLHPLRHLERGVLSFLLAMQEGSAPPADDVALSAALEAASPDLDAAPWYGREIPVPVCHEAGQLAIPAAMLRRAAGAAGVRCAMIACEAIDADEFNRQVAALGNKAGVNFGAMVRLIERVWRRWPTEHPRIVVDRAGGRAHYREPLRMCFPEASITVLGETPRVSRYRLERDGSAVTLSFECESEDRHLPAALASMTAKYVRELRMSRLNTFFAERVPEIRPTAGYVQDGRRFLRDIEPVVTGLGIDRDRLVRRV